MRFTIFSPIFFYNKNIYFLLNFSVGSDASVELVESTAVTFFEILHDSDKIGHDETIKLRNAIGPFPAKRMSHVCAAIQSVVKHVPPELLERTFSEENGNKRGAEFGSTIHFSFQQKTLPSDEDLSDDSEDETYEFSFGYDASAVASSSNTSAPKGLPTSAASKADVGAGKQWDLSWLRRQVQARFGEKGSESLGLGVEALSVKLINDLVSEKTNDELQNEVCLYSVSSSPGS